MNTHMKNLGIRSELTDILAKNGITEATPVQERAIPMLLAGRDVIAHAQTGTGKTLAFVLPILEIIDPGKPYIQALIITPTRELAIQITTEIKKLAPIIGAGVLPVYGGQDVISQIHKLKKGTQIVVGTPGRLLDHIERGTIHLAKVSMLVLDEADQMLDMGFLSEVEEIIQQTSKQRQTMLFSATIPASLRKLAANYMRNPEDIRIQGKRTTLEGIKQWVVETTDRGKQPTLIRMIELYQPYLAVVFCRTKIRTKKLTAAMQDHGINADELHGDLTQSKREQVMKQFREAKLQVLVATDVAARGLDIEGVTHVFNYDIPHDAESYIHRIGRTGRAGQAGFAITFATTHDRMHLQLIERAIAESIERKSMHSFGVGSGDELGDEEIPGRQPKTRRKQPSEAGSRRGTRGAGRERGAGLVGRGARTEGRRATTIGRGASSDERGVRAEGRRASTVGRGAGSDERGVRAEGRRVSTAGRSVGSDERGARAEGRKASTAGRSVNAEDRGIRRNKSTNESRSVGSGRTKNDNRGSNSSWNTNDNRGTKTDRNTTDYRGSNTNRNANVKRGAISNRNSAGNRSAGGGNRSTSGSRGSGAGSRRGRS